MQGFSTTTQPKKTARKELSKRIITAMKSFDEQHTEAIHKAADDLFSLEMHDVTHEGDDAYLYAKTGKQSNAYALRVAEVDVLGAYKRAVKALPEDSATQYEDYLLDHPEDWEHSRWSEGTLDSTETKARVVALHSLGVIAEVEAAAVQQVDYWRDKRKSAVDKLPKEIRDEVTALWKTQSRAMGRKAIEVPQEIKNVPTSTVVAATTPDGEPTVKPLPLLKKNLFGWASEENQYPTKYGSTWEKDVLDKELPAPTLKGWYRNPSSGKHALAIPYRSGKGEVLLHPDFLFLHQASGDSDIVIDIVDPHRHTDSDTGPKWRALAQYTAEVAVSVNPNWLRRVVAVIKVGTTLRALDLREEESVAAMQGVDDKAGVEAAFVAHGFDY